MQSGIDRQNHGLKNRLLAMKVISCLICPLHFGENNTRRARSDFGKNHRRADKERKPHVVYARKGF
jgi:hypothetical protein